MSVIQTYDSLVLNVQQYMERNDPDFIAQIPNLIALAESSIAAELKTYMQLIVVETSLAQNQTVLNKPARWRKTVSMKINGEPVTHRSQDYVAQVQSEFSNAQPLYYADYDYDHWALGPTPDSAYSVEIIYYSRIQPLDSSNQENLITREAPQALLFGTLLQCQGYLKSPDKLQLWQGMYDKSMAALKGENASRNIDRNTSVQEP